jgi:hypothetical protein
MREVPVNAGVIRLKGRPESMYPCPLFFEALGARGVFADVERVAGAPGISSAGTGCHSAASYLNTKPRANKQGTMRTTKVE